MVLDRIPDPVVGAAALAARNVVEHVGVGGVERLRPRARALADHPLAVLHVHARRRVERGPRLRVDAAGGRAVLRRARGGRRALPDHAGHPVERDAERAAALLAEEVARRVPVDEALLRLGVVVVGLEVLREARSARAVSVAVRAILREGVERRGVARVRGLALRAVVLVVLRGRGDVGNVRRIARRIARRTSSSAGLVYFGHELSKQYSSPAQAGRV